MSSFLYSVESLCALESLYASEILDVRGFLYDPEEIHRREVGFPKATFGGLQ
ncbi:hypothetical protein G7Y31_07280 [Corynebacterium lizhenjunii]|uniref:Uncharacterized protein n=1 Tax=Corynebacterium lizhenjunii TaxID=2709394 RepID=A0A7T0PAI0_9CORY|nr:hypothetical protein [Corynebacterium lizhenjunii]QPK78375.1 hypothetical protein G7Y31_07280 [Corynebacterium lizhenjunii]